MELDLLAVDVDLVKGMAANDEQSMSKPARQQTGKSP
jgi:hypothetical protein